MRLEEGIKRSQANKLYLSWRNLILLLSNDAFVVMTDKILIERDIL